MSQIAIANAFFRARESANPDGQRILDDPFAVGLVRTQWRLQALWSFRWLVPGLAHLFDQLQTVHCVRHAAVDALVREGLEKGAQQVVLLGAGLDARAERLGQSNPQVRWFEVDRSPYIGHKRGVLAQVDDRVVHVTADLSVTGWETSLLKAGLNPDLPTLWVAEGLIHYLPEGTLEKLLHDVREITAAPRVVISFIRPDMVSSANSTLKRVLSWLGELPRIYFSATQLGEMGAQTNWASVKTWTFDQQVDDFAPSARTRSHGVSQDVALFCGQFEV